MDDAPRIHANREKMLEKKAEKKKKKKKSRHESERYESDSFSSRDRSAFVRFLIDDWHLKEIRHLSARTLFDEGRTLLRSRSACPHEKE